MGRLIVLADDDPDLRAVYARALRLDGHRVEEAGDGAEALELVHRCKPDLLLLDVWMPAVNGFDVLESLRHAPDASRLKVVMLSNLDDAETRLEGFSGGLSDYWVKGLALTDLLERVRQALGSGDPAG